MKYFIALIFLFFFPFLSPLSASLPSHPPTSTKQLKAELLNLYQNNRHTFLCQEPFNEKGQISVKVCPHCQKMLSKIQWMPIVSLQHLAKHLRCYQEKSCISKKGKLYKGVRCCLEQDPSFKLAARDLHNFVPEQKAIIGLRHHFVFGSLSEKSENNAKTCELMTDDKKKLIHTPLSIRGMVARTYLYMRDTYYLPLTDEEVSRYQNWHQEYPPCAWEKARNEQIGQIQGNINPYIK